MKGCVLIGVLAGVNVLAGPFAVNDTSPRIERWMYANSAVPCDRSAGSVFGTLGDEAGVDTRHAQHLLGWDTDTIVPANLGPRRYLVRRCRVTLTINRGNLFAYDPTQDAFTTYFQTNHPHYEADADAGRPMELYGAGFRNGYDAASFEQCTAFGSNAPGQRHAYAAGYSTNGVLVDVSNNVGKTNQAYMPFEVAPFAIGRTASTSPGQLVPAGAKITFELHLNDPFVLEYLQQALHHGRLRLIVSSLHGTAGQLGAPSYPDFATRFNEAVLNPTRLELEGVAAGDSDVDSDGLPDDWETFYWGTTAHHGATDSDGDGASNLAEFHAGTDPANAASALLLFKGPDTTLRFPFAASRRYKIEFTESYNTWTEATSPLVFELPFGMARWTDSSTGAARRFYRVRVD